jgi:hypothetical protein
MRSRLGLRPVAARITRVATLSGSTGCLFSGGYEPSHTGTRGDLT